MMWLVLLCVVIIVGISGFFIRHEVEKSKSRKAMSTALHRLPDFTVSQEFIGENGLSGMAYDESASSICLLNKNGEQIETRIVKDRDILSVELIEDGVSTFKTKLGSQLGSALLGVIAFGPLGAMVGGLSGSRTNKVNGIYLQLVVNDKENPIHEVCFLNTIEASKTGIIYKMAYNKAIYWQSLIETMIQRADDADQKNEAASEDGEQQQSIACQIRELARLRDEGLLTEEEFVAQKSNLLG